MPGAAARATELRIAAWLSDALDTFVDQHGPFSSQDVVAGCAEFITQVCTRAYTSERNQGTFRPVDAMAAEMDALGAAIAGEIVMRLHEHWTPD